MRILLKEIKEYHSVSLSQVFGRAGRILYAVSTYAVMFVLVRVWGEMMPSHSYFYSMSWAIGFIPMFGILWAFSRFYFKNAASELDANWPMIKQSIFVAFTFAVNYWGVSTSAPHVNGPAQVVFSQVPTAVAALLTALVFRRIYHPLAVVGIILTIAGTVVQSVEGNLHGSTKFGNRIMYPVDFFRLGTCFYSWKYSWSYLGCRIRRIS